MPVPDVVIAAIAMAHVAALATRKLQDFCDAASSSFSLGTRIA